jgi:hypothetical protein
MHDLQTVEIPTSKLKMGLMLLGCLAFVTIGVLFVTHPESYLSIVCRSSAKIFTAGCLGIVFFGFIGVTIIKKLFDKTPGLIISGDGITDNSGGLPAGFVPWSDIVAVKETTVVRQRFINLVVKNHEDYVLRQKSALKRWIMRKNFKVYRTGIGISPNALKIDYDDLKEIIEKRFSDFTTKRNSMEFGEKTTN